MVKAVMEVREELIKQGYPSEITIRLEL